MNNKELEEAIETIAKGIVKSLQYAENGFDRTFISVIKANNNNGTYTVLDEYGTERTCVSALPNTTFSIGQRVYITIPCGNLKNMFISGIHPQINKR